MTRSSEMFLEAKTSVVFCSQKRVMGVHEPFAFLLFLLLLFKMFTKLTSLLGLCHLKEAH